MNNIDPSGKFISGLVGVLNAITVYVMLRGMEYGPKIAAGLWAATKITAAALLATITYTVLAEFGVVPKSEFIAEIGAILGYALIAELFIMSMLPASWTSPPQTMGKGVNNSTVRKAVQIGNRVHYDKLTDASKYSHEGGPSQLQRIYNRGTEFQFARRGQSGVDVKWTGVGPHPSTYPNSKWPVGINKADIKPDTPTGRAFKLPSDVFRILYDPQTGEIKQ